MKHKYPYPYYKEYIQSPYWNTLVEQYRARHCFCCSDCGELHLHHITYDNVGQETHLDFVTLCFHCHLTVHKLVKKGFPLNITHFLLRRSNYPTWPWVDDWESLGFCLTKQEKWKFLKDNGLVLDQYPSKTAMVKSLCQEVYPKTTGRYRWNKEKFDYFLEDALSKRDQALLM